MKMYIPSIGDQIQLTKDWYFDLYNESRNETVMERLGDMRGTHWTPSAIRAVIPAGAILKIDRIYIRKGLDEYSSITFLWKGETTEGKLEERRPMIIGGPRHGETTTYTVKKPRRPVRFWAKLNDVNNIEFDPA